MAKKRIGIDMDNGDVTSDGSVAYRTAMGVKGSLGRGNGHDVDVVFYGDKENIHKVFSGDVPGDVVSSERFYVDGEDIKRPVKGTSLNNLIRDIKKGEFSSFFTIGDTAKVGIETVGLKRIRSANGKKVFPALVVRAPSKKGFYLFSDIGLGNSDNFDNNGIFYKMVVDRVARRTFDNGVMTAAYANNCLGVENPRIGILSNGVEEYKGSDLVKRVDKMFRSVRAFGEGGSVIRYVGKVEPNMAMGGDVDVLLTDGFTGNVSVKFLEAFYDLLGFFKDKRTEELGVLSKLLAVPGIPVSKKVRARVMEDLGEKYVSGAVLLGYRNGLIVKGHGASSVEQISSGLRTTAICSSDGLVDSIEDALVKYSLD